MCALPVGRRLLEREGSNWRSILCAQGLFGSAVVPARDRVYIAWLCRTPMVVAHFFFHVQALALAEQPKRYYAVG